LPERRGHTISEAMARSPNLQLVSWSCWGQRSPAQRE
jgi:hypothetical protein